MQESELDLMLEALNAEGVMKTAGEMDWRWVTECLAVIAA